MNELKLRAAIERIEVPEFVVWLDSKLSVKTRHLTDKTVDELLALFTQELQARLERAMDAMPHKEGGAATGRNYWSGYAKGNNEAIDARLAALNAGFGDLEKENV